MTKDRLLGIIKGNAKHPNCAVTILEAVEQYIVSLSTHRSDPDDKDREIERLKGLIKKAHDNGNLRRDGTKLHEQAWQQFKTDNQL